MFTGITGPPSQPQRLTHVTQQKSSFTGGKYTSFAAGLGCLTLLTIAVGSVKQVVLDLGRKPEARFAGAVGGEYLRDEEVSQCDNTYSSSVYCFIGRHSTNVQHSSNVALSQELVHHCLLLGATRYWLLSLHHTVCRRICQ